MAGDFDFAGFVTAWEAYFHGVTDLALDPPIHVTQELDLPTTDTCPHVTVALGDADYTPQLVTHLQIEAQGDLLEFDAYLACTAFSAESAADAARQRDRVVERMNTAIRRNPTVDGRVKVIRRAGVRFEWRADESGIFAAAVIRCRAMAWV